MAEERKPRRVFVLTSKDGEYTEGVYKSRSDAKRYMQSCGMTLQDYTIDEWEVEEFPVSTETGDGG